MRIIWAGCWGIGLGIITGCALGLLFPPAFLPSHDDKDLAAHAILGIIAGSIVGGLVGVSIRANKELTAIGQKEMEEDRLNKRAMTSCDRIDGSREAMD